MRAPAQPWQLLVALALLGPLGCAPRARLLEANAVPPRDLDTGWSTHLDTDPPDAWTPWTLGARRPERSQHTGATFRIVLPAGGWTEPAIFFAAIDSAYSATLDGRPLAELRSDADPQGFSPGGAWQLLRLPGDFAGKTLELHATSHNPYELGPEPPVWLGARSDLLQAMLGPGLLRTVIGLLAFAMGLIGVGLFVVRPRDRFHLAFGLFALAQGAATVAAAEAKQLVLDAPMLWWAVLTAARLVAPPAILAFAELTSSAPPRWAGLLWRAQAALSLAIGLTLLVHPASYLHLWRLLNVQYLVGFGAALAVLVLGTWRRRAEPAALLLGTAAFLLSGVHDAFAAVHFLSGTPHWGPWGLLALLLVLGAVEVERLAAVYRSQAASLAELERKNALLTAAGLELQAAVQARDEFLSVASHELRTPVSAMVLQLDLLARPARAEQARAALVRQVDRLQQLVLRLLDVSRIQGRRLVLDLEPVDLARLARDAVERTREAQEPQTPVRFEGEESLTGHWDRVRLEQVVVNLISNAIKYGEQRPVTVRVQRRGDGAVLEVADQGMGIALADQARIFQRFERAVTSRNISGMGLGLWITQAIVRELGGTITLESAPARGATFTVTLPLAGPGGSSTRS